MQPCVESSKWSILQHQNLKEINPEFKIHLSIFSTKKSEKNMKILKLRIQSY